MKNLIKDFRAFVMRGNVLDLALAVVIGAAFGKIVSSLVEDIIMPPIGFLIGGVSFGDLAITLTTGLPDAAAVTINYGKFVQALVDFLIIAFVLFMVLRLVAKFQKKKDEAPAAPPADIVLLTEIRDLLKR